MFDHMLVSFYAVTKMPSSYLIIQRCFPSYTDMNSSINGSLPSCADVPLNILRTNEQSLLVSEFEVSGMRLTVFPVRVWPGNNEEAPHTMR